MFGLIVLIAIGLYFLLSIAVVRSAIGYARKHGKSAKRWGWGAALGMYLLVFWDWVPTVVTHKYYCSTEAGFWVYKTVDQWKAENPGVLETLKTPHIPAHKYKGDETQSISTTSWNSRIASTLERQGKLFINVWRREDKIIDVKTGEILARFVDFSTSQEHRQAGWSGWRFWLDSENCANGHDKAIQFVEFVEQFKGIKDELR